MTFQPKEKYTFKVEGVKRDGANVYYLIKVNGEETYIKAFEFQKNNTPSELKCICKGLDYSGRPIIMQDLAAVIEELYHVGYEGDFFVKNFQYSSYYEVVDENGLCMRLTKFPSGAKIEPRQMVRCRITFINLVRVEMELIEVQVAQQLPLLSVQDFLNLPDTKKIHNLYLKRLITKLPVFQEARRELMRKNPLWVMAAINAIDRHLTQWLLSDMPYKRELLETYISGCLNLLENSDFLSYAQETEKAEYQSILSRIIIKAEDYLEALNLEHDKLDQRFIDETFERLSKSEYLYRPERRMRVAMSLFLLRRKSMRHYISRIFAIIKEKHNKRRFMELFRAAFVEMLDIFISSQENDSRVIVSNWDNVTTNEMVEALAIQLLLTSDAGGGSLSQPVYKSMLYRHASLLDATEGQRRTLVDKSFAALMGRFNPQLEYGWSDLDFIKVLCSKLASRGAVPDVKGQLKIFEGENICVSVAGQRIDIAPKVQGMNMKGVLPTDHPDIPEGVQIWLNERTEEKIPLVNATLNHYSRAWNEIENLITAKQVVTRVARQRKPMAGDEMLIRITGIDKNNKYRFFCKVEDPEFTGTGYLSPTGDIVSYSVYATPEMFKDPSTGCPFLFRAEVEKVDPNGACHFKMRQGVRKMIYEQLDEDMEHLVQISDIRDKHYLAISEDGVTMYLPREADADYKLYSFVYASIREKHPDGSVRAHIEGYADQGESFDRVDAFYELMKNYAEDIFDPSKSFVNTDSDDAGDAETISADAIKELISIIDRRGMQEKRHELTYNYLALARIIAMAAGEDETALYYKKRMELSMTLCEFGQKGKISNEELEALEEALANNGDMVSNHPDIARRLNQLRIMNQLDNPTPSEFLWNNVKEHLHTLDSSLAELVLAYNLLRTHDAYNIRKELRNKILSKLDLEVPMLEGAVVAREDQYNELKTSIIYPAGEENHMFANEKVQMDIILKAICSFLNTRGGTLYIGVNDPGFAVGLDADFQFLNGRRPNYDLEHIKDVFDRRVRDAVFNRLGVLANEKVNGNFEEVDGKWIFRVEVEPCPELIRLDGVAYVRQGRSKHPVAKSEEAALLRSRKKEFTGPR